ncbi:MAG TPA: DUF2127 domain-containing protein [Candidatus Udaeobacter sp.]|jgi:uncharacterized membrane protein (DUF2068 family)|nr:DUF2127 domain-containing protein [Candidatus Udaeobacter sp.]
MSRRAHESAMVQDARRLRYLKLIALFKVAKGLLLLLLAGSLLFVNARTHAMDELLKWIANEILLQHSKTVRFVLHSLQSVLSGGMLRATAFLSLFYAALFLIEGIGVYMQQRWAAWLIIIESAALIPIELRHLWHRPGMVGAAILVANCFIVWFLYRVVKRDNRHALQPPELVETI